MLISFYKYMTSSVFEKAIHFKKSKYKISSYKLYIYRSVFFKKYHYRNTIIYLSNLYIYSELPNVKNVFHNYKIIHNSGVFTYSFFFKKIMCCT